MELHTPDISQATSQLSSTDLGAAYFLLFFAIFLAISAYIYFMNKQLNIAADDREVAKKEKDSQRLEHENLLRELKGTLDRLADVQETTMDFIKETVVHERKNHEQCKDKFFEKLVDLEYYLKSGVKVCDIKRTTDSK